MSQRRWEWYFGDLNHKCGNACGESLIQGRGSLVKYQGQIYHVHCLIDKLTAQTPLYGDACAASPYGFHTP